MLSKIKDLTKNVSFPEKDLNIRELEKKLNFLDSFPIKVESKERQELVLHLYSPNFVCIHPLNEKISYHGIEKLNGCTIEYGNSCLILDYGKSQGKYLLHETPPINGVSYSKWSENLHKRHEIPYYKEAIRREPHHNF